MDMRYTPEASFQKTLKKFKTDLTHGKDNYGYQSDSCLDLRIF